MQFGGKKVVDGKIVVAFNLLGFWLLVQNSLACLPTGKRLQGSDQVLFRYLRLFLDLLEEIHKHKPRHKKTLHAMSTSLVDPPKGINKEICLSVCQ